MLCAKGRRGCEIEVEKKDDWVFGMKYYRRGVSLSTMARVTPNMNVLLKLRLWLTEETHDRQ